MCKACNLHVNGQEVGVSQERGENPSFEGWERLKTRWKACDVVTVVVVAANDPWRFVSNCP